MMIQLPARLAPVALLALVFAVTGCSRDEPEQKVVAAPAKPAKAAPLAAPATPVPPPHNEPFAPTVPPPSGPPEVLVKEALPTAGPVANDVEAWEAGEAAFQHYASVNGFGEEATKSFFLKHMANNGDHYRLMMFGVLAGGPRYIAIKVYRDGRTEVLPDEM